MREMGQSAWLSTSATTLQGTEGKSQCEAGTNRAVTTGYHGGNNYSLWPVTAEGRQTLEEESESCFVPRSCEM